MRPTQGYSEQGFFLPNSSLRTLSTMQTSMVLTLRSLLVRSAVKFDLFPKFVFSRQLYPVQLNEFNPTILNSRYFKSRRLRVREADRAIYQRHGVKFILSNVGFLYNPKLIYNYTTKVFSNILKERYSFFSIDHVKRVLIKRRGLNKFKNILAAYPASRAPKVYDSLEYHSPVSSLTQVNSLIHQHASSTSFNHIHDEQGHRHLYIQTFRPAMKQRVRIKRIRFKPGYSRI